jgi:hypothetical protein
MRIGRTSWIAAAWLAVCTPCYAQQAAAPLSAEAAFLAGDWGEVRDGEAVKCGSPGAGDQFAFEFARSGGRALLYEAPDLYSSFGGLELHTEGGLIAVWARARDGALKQFTSVRRTGPDTFEFVKRDGSAGGKWQRCPLTENPVAADVDTATLLALTPAITGGQGFAQLRPGESAADLCNGKIAYDPLGQQRGWMQFELLGPVHYVTMGNVPTIQDFSSVRAVRQTEPNVLRITLYNWIRKANVEISVRVAADHIDILELGMTFARCAADQPGGVGMHRM